MSDHDTDAIDDKYKDAYKDYLGSLCLSELFERVAEMTGTSIKDTLRNYILDNDPTGLEDADFYDIRCNL